MTSIFVGVIVVAIIGNAAEHSTALMMALQEPDGPGARHRRRLEHPDRAVRRPGPGPGELFARPAADGSGLLAGGSVGVVVAVMITGQIASDGETTGWKACSSGGLPDSGAGFFFLPESAAAH